jgi:hypothetical protein
MLEAAAAAGVAAAVVFLLCAWPWRSPRSARASVGAVLGVGVGFFLGCWLLGLRPHWPPREDQDRLFFVLFPAVLGLEVVLLLVPRKEGARWQRGCVWLVRLIVAGSAAPVLLYNTSYLAELAGPGSREWTPGQAGFILTGLAAALAGLWAALGVLVSRTASRVVPLAIAVACGGTAITVMLSGYATGGQIGLPLAAALVGAVAASLALSNAPDLSGLVGVGTVGLYALLIVGRFFGELTTGNALLLFLAPLLCWVPELPYLRRVGPRLRGVARLALVLVPVSLALALAQHRFEKDSAAPSPGGAEEPTLQDYLDFGK